MGGYGLYVWAAYGVAFLLMVALLWLSWNGAKSSQREFEALRSQIRPAASKGRKSLTATRPDRPREIQNSTP